MANDDMPDKRESPLRDEQTDDEETEADKVVLHDESPSNTHTYTHFSPVC